MVAVSIKLPQRDPLFTVTFYIFWVSYPVNGESGDYVEWSLQTKERNEAEDKSRIFQRRLESSGG